MNFKKKFFVATFFVLYSMICQSKDIILMESHENNDSSVSYRLNFLHEKEEVSKLLLEQPMPIDIIQCRNNRLIYLTNDGTLWQMSLQNSDIPSIIGKVAPSVSKGGSIFGFNYLNMESNYLIVLHNTLKEESGKAKREYFLTRYSFDGKSDVLASGNDLVYSFREISPDIIELITEDALINVNINTKEIDKITSFNKNSISRIMRVIDGYSIIHRNKKIEIRDKFLGDSIRNFNFDNEASIITDFDTEEGKLLMTVLNQVSSNKGILRIKENLMEFELKNKDGHIIYHPESSIGGACYLRK